MIILYKIKIPSLSQSLVSPLALSVHNQNQVRFDIWFEIEPTKPQTPVFCKPHACLTLLAIAKTTGVSSHQMDTRTSNFWEYCRRQSKIWEKPSRTSKLLKAITRLGKQSAVLSILKSKEYNEFIASVGKGDSNEAQFHTLVIRSALSLYSNPSKSQVLFVRNENDLFYSRFYKKKISTSLQFLLQSSSLIFLRPMLWKTKSCIITSRIVYISRCKLLANRNTASNFYKMRNHHCSSHWC